MKKGNVDSPPRQSLLWETAERMRLVLSSTQQGLFDLDLGTGAMVVNDQYPLMLGYDPKQFHETLETWYMRVHRDDIAGILNTYTDYIAGRRSGYQVEFREKKRDGSWIWILTMAAIVSRDEQGRPQRMVGTRLDITERKSAEREQHETDQRLVFALEAASLGDWNMDLRTNVAWRSLQHDQCFGYTEPVPEWGYETFLNHVIPEDRAGVHSCYTAAMAGKEQYDVEFRVRWPDGSLHWLWSKGRFFFDDDGKPYRVAGIVADITRRKHTEASALESENRYRLLFENSMDAVFQTRDDGRIIAANPAACSMFHATTEELLTLSREELVDGNDPRVAPLVVARSMTGRAQGEVWMIRADNTRFEAEVTTVLYYDQSGSAFISMVVRDITERKKAAEEIRRLAFFDHLTGLPNRRWLTDHLKGLQAASRRSGLVSALLFVDLDHFKLVNDARGHMVGDRLLNTIAHRLRNSLRGQDAIARLGGDEFVIILANLGADIPARAAQVAQRAETLRSVIQQPIEINGQFYKSSASMGITFIRNEDETVDDLLREADTAMYHAKAAGRNCVVFYEARMREEIETRLAVERELETALDSGHLSLHCQPQFDREGNTAGAEFLLRWTHPVRGDVSPAYFIPLAEQSETILRIGNWVLKHACLAVARARALGITFPFSINVSPKQFRQPGFVPGVRHIINLTRAPAPQLIFEITEGLLIENFSETIEQMNELAALGIRFSIDDFGTGYSSLKYLKNLPLYELKIDRSFLSDIDKDAGDAAIVRSMISIAQNLKLRVVAEGMETSMQAHSLITWGCDCLQGNYLARPMPVPEFLDSLTAT